MLFPYWINPVSEYSGLAAVIDSPNATGHHTRVTQQASKGSQRMNGSMIEGLFIWTQDLWSKTNHNKHTICKLKQQNIKHFYVWKDWEEAET